MYKDHNIISVIYLSYCYDNVLNDKYRPTIFSALKIVCASYYKIKTIIIHYKR